MKRLHVTAIPLLMVLSLLVSFSVTNAQDWYDVNWQYRKAIIIDAGQVSGPLTNFPLLVNITDADLQSKALSNGDDILFTGDDGIIKLDHEIESYDDVAGSLITWVRIPSLSSTADTVIYMYYGNPAASPQENIAGVWDASYVMVQHLDETSGNHIDSKLNNDGTPSVTVQGTASGQVNGADEFDGSLNELVNCGNDSSLDITGSITVEAWAYSDIASPSLKRIVSKDRTGEAGKFMLWGASSGNLTFQVADAADTWYLASGPSIVDGVWMHVVGVYDTDTQQVKLYKDGFEIDAVGGPLSLASNPENVTIGAADLDITDPEYQHNWDGILDEVRISNTARSAEWIKTSHTNQNDPGSFYLLGSERVLGMWWNSKWNYRKVITVDAGQVSGPLTNFPLLVNITDTDLASDAQPDGDDIAFTDINGTQLSHEIELYDDGTGHLISWVNLPGLSSTEDTLLFMYFGNSAADNQEDRAGTWDSNYVMVQHLNETSGDHLDSTGNANDGTTVVVSDQGIAPGQINGADDFDGIGDYVRVPDAASLQFDEGSFTAEAWIYPRSVPDANGVRIVNNRGAGTSGANPGWQLKIEDSSGNWVVGRSAIDDAAGNFQRYDGTTPYSYNQWYRLVMVYEADNELRFYVNGDLDGTLPIGPYGDITNSLPTVIGASLANEGVELASGDQLFDGIIDEVRLSNLVRSNEWIVTSYTNQSDPGSFSQAGGLELEPCEGDFDCDGDVDGSDAQDFKLDFGRSQFVNPCESGNPCHGDYNCDGDVDGGDAILFKADFGRSSYKELCPACVVGEWCAYP